MFYLKDKSKQKSAIVAIIRFKGQRYKLPTGESVAIKAWNASKYRSRSGLQYQDGYNINEKLDLIEANIKRALNDFNLRDVIPTQKELEAEIQRKEVENETSFSDFMQQEIETLRPAKAVSTIKKYITTLHKVTDYEKDRKVKLRFQDIDIHFYKDFKNWFYQEETHKTKNYFGSIIKNIKRFCNIAYVNKLHSADGYKHPDFKTEQEDADTVYLSEKELQKIYTTQITEEKIREITPGIYAQNLKRKIEAMERARSRFLIGAYTILRVSDYKRLTEVNVRDGFIRIKPIKRSKGRKNRDVVIPMHPIVKEILSTGIDLTETISEQKINKHIKDVCQIAGINGTEIIVRTEKGREVEHTFKKYELITTHTARRSAATNMLMAGMEASDIMMLGGWNSEKAFWRYIRMEPELNAQRLQQHPFFK